MSKRKWNEVEHHDATDDSITGSIFLLRLSLEELQSIRLSYARALPLLGLWSGVVHGVGFTIRLLACRKVLTEALVNVDPKSEDHSLFKASLRLLEKAQEILMNSRFNGCAVGVLIWLRENGTVGWYAGEVIDSDDHEQLWVRYLTKRKCTTLFDPEDMQVLPSFADNYVEAQTNKIYKESDRLFCTQEASLAFVEGLGRRDKSQALKDIFERARGGNCAAQIHKILEDVVHEPFSKCEESLPANMLILETKIGEEIASLSKEHNAVEIAAVAAGKLAKDAVLASASLSEEEEEVEDQAESAAMSAAQRVREEKGLRNRLKESTAYLRSNLSDLIKAGDGVGVTLHMTLSSSPIDLFQRSESSTLLHEAAKRGNFNITQTVLNAMIGQLKQKSKKKTFYVDSLVDKDGRNALHLAMGAHQWSVVSLLFEHIQDPHKEDFNGSSHLAMLASEGEPSQQVQTAEAFFSCLAEREAREIEALETEDERAAYKRQAELLRSKADKRGLSPLGWALMEVKSKTTVEKGQFTELASVLMKNGCCFSKTEREQQAVDLSCGQDPIPVKVEKSIDENKKRRIPSFCYTSKIIGNRVSKKKGCKCIGRCTPTSGCACGLRGFEGKFPYCEKVIKKEKVSGKKKKKKIVSERRVVVLRNSSQQVFECGPDCNCACSRDPNAPMTNAQTGRRPKCMVKWSKTTGYGLRTTEEIVEGETVVHYAGRVVERQELKEKRDEIGFVR